MDDPLTFVSPEGIYTQIEEHKPPVLHSYFSTQNATSPTAAQMATKISVVALTFPAIRQPSSQAFTSLLGGNKTDKQGTKKLAASETKHQPTLPAVQDKDESESSGEHPNLNADDQGDNPPRNPSPTPAVEHPHPVLFSPTLGAGLPAKKKSTRSKQNLKTTTSSFVTRYQAMEGFNKHLAMKTGDVNFMFYHSGKSFYMTEVETGNKLKEPLIRITFNAWPTCHAVNQSTANSSSLDVVIGFNTGDLMWFDPMNTRYLRLNKQGCISSSPCTAIRWVPGSRTLFLVSHADGTIVVHDKERDDDANFTPSTPPTGPSATSSPLLAAQPSPSIMTHSTVDDSTAVTSLDTPVEPLQSTPFSFTGLGRHLQLPTTTANRLASSSTMAATTSSSLPAWDPNEQMWVTRPGGAGDGSDVSVADKEKEKEMALAATKNPVSHWKVSKKGIVDFVFSPDVRYIAIVSEDGNLRVVDALTETLVDTYASYFGSLTCVAWSPDGRFIAVGGQDDLITIISPHEQRVIARCQGHVSFVAGVAFDPVRCDGRNYRFASVGEDCRLLLWDFSSGALHRPRLLTAQQHRSSVSSQHSLVLRTMSTGAGGGRGSFEAYDSVSGVIGGPFEHATNASKFHPAPSRKEVSLVQPILSKAVEGDLLSCVSVVSGAIVVASRPGSIKVWSRPQPPVRGPRRSKGGKKKDEAGVGASTISGGGGADLSAVRVAG